MNALYYIHNNVIDLWMIFISSIHEVFPLNIVYFVFIIIQDIKLFALCHNHPFLKHERDITCSELKLSLHADRRIYCIHPSITMPFQT